MRALARPLLASVFIWDGIDALRNPQPHVELLEPYDGVLDRATETVPGLPSNRRTLVRISGGVSVAAGVLLALGKAPRAASAALTVIGAQSAVVRHPFWSVKGPRRRQELKEFLTRGAITAGAVFAVADRRGKPSATWRLDNWRTHRAELNELSQEWADRVDLVKEKHKGKSKPKGKPAGV